MGAFAPLPTTVIIKQWYIFLVPPYLKCAPSFTTDQDIQLMILISLMVQLFLLFTGNLRRSRIDCLLRLMVWLAYVGEDIVVVFPIGILSQYEDKYKLGNQQLTED